MAVVNRTGSLLRISILGKNLTTNEIDIYQISITTGETISLSADTLSSGNYDMITVKGRDGSIIGQVQGDEQDPEGEISFSFYEDFMHVGKGHVYGNSKNRLLNILNGESFVNGGDVIVPIGTNGTDKTKTARAKFNEMNKPCRMVFYNEGEFIKENGTADALTGRVQLKKNPYKSSFDTFNKTFCFEVMTTSSEGQVNRMYPILAKTSAEWVEGDINQFNCTANRGCDSWEKDDFFSEINILPADKRKAFLVNFNEISLEDITDLTTEGGIPVLADSELTALLTIGTRLKAINEAGELVIAVVGEDKKLVDFSTNGSKRYFTGVKDFDLKVSHEFEAYKPV
ncbi:MAG: hypothetical protein ACRCZ0_11500 [Cetobacterium sp.]